MPRESNNLIVPYLREIRLASLFREKSNRQSTRREQSNQLPRQDLLAPAVNQAEPSAVT